MASDDDMAKAWADALEADGGDTETETEIPEPEMSAPSGVRTTLPAMDREGTDDNLELLMDVPVTVSVEIGRTSLSIKEVLDLNPGSIVSLGKLAGEPMDLLVNGKRIAQGEIVIVDESFGIRDSFGIRVTSILGTL